MFLAKNPELLAAFKRGDQDALETVYRHYCPGVTAFLRKGFTFRSSTGNFYFKGIENRSELASSVQEVFRRAFEPRARQSYNGVNSFTNWVLAISRNMVINEFRNREVNMTTYIASDDLRSHMKVMEDEANLTYRGVLFANTDHDQDAGLERSEIQELIQSFMAKLTDYERKLLLYRFAEGHGQEDTAQLLQSTRMRIRTAETKLRARLRAYLKQTGYLDHLHKHASAKNRHISKHADR